MLRRAFWLVLLGLCSLAWAQDFDYDRYRLSVYLHAGNKPDGVRYGRCVYDLSEQKWWDKLFGELGRIGINSMTFHSAFRPRGALYEPLNPDLPRSNEWEGLDPVTICLDTCERFGMEGFLGIYLGHAMKEPYPLARAVVEDLIAKFGREPAFDGIVLPIEAAEQYGLSDEQMAELAALGRSLRPGLKTMDYPFGPFGAHTLRSVLARYRAGAVDVYNVQFYLKSPSFDSMLGPRGATRVILGCLREAEPIIHTHYLERGGQWIGQPDAYWIRQGVLLTATPYGESIWSYLHGFWGVQHWHEPTDALWRRLAWYEGLLMMQRLEPFFAGAKPVAPVAIFVPQATQFGALGLANDYWAALAAGGLAPDVTAGVEAQLGQYECMVVPSLCGLSEEEARLLDGYAQAGGHLIITPRVAEPSKSAVPAELSDRTKRILGLSDGQLATAAALWQRAQAAAEVLLVAPGPVENPTTSGAGEGTITLVPALRDWLRPHLSEVVSGMLSDRMVCEGLGEDYFVEAWAKGEGLHQRLLLCTAIKEGASAEGSRIRLPLAKPPLRVAFLAPGRCGPVEARYADGELTIELPELDDSFGAVLLTDGSYPVLMPAHEIIECKSSETVEAPCSLLNLTSEPLTGELTVDPPAGFRLLRPATQEYSLAPGEKADFDCLLEPPPGVTREPHIIIYRTRGLTQRTVILPTGGAERIITDMELTPEEYVATADRKSWPDGTEPLGVTAGEKGDTNHRRTPGVAFYQPIEWDAPAEHLGKIARFGEMLPRLGGPNSMINGLDKRSDWIVTVTYRSDTGATLKVYDGDSYLNLADLPAGEDWQTVEAQLPAEVLKGEKMDRGPGPAWDLLCAFEGGAIWVHRIEVRRETAVGD